MNKWNKIVIIILSVLCGYTLQAADYPVSSQEIADLGFNPFKTYTTHENVYVNPVTGSYKARAEDLRLSWWNDFDLVINRYYDSSLQKADNEGGTGHGYKSFSFGNGWRLGLPYIEGVYFEDGINDFYFSVTLPDGQVFNVRADMSIVYDGRNSKSNWSDGETTSVHFECHSGSSDFTFISNLEYRESFLGWFFGSNGWFNTGFSLIMKDGTRFLFNKNGLPVEIRDALGYKNYTISYWYPDRLLKSITDGQAVNPRYLNFAHDGDFISYIGVGTDDYGRAVGYEQDGNGNLVEVNVAGNNVFRTWEYGYTGVAGMTGEYLYTLSGPDVEQVKITPRKMSLTKRITEDGVTENNDISRAVVDNLMLYKKVPYYSSYEELARTVTYQYSKTSVTYYSEGNRIVEDCLNETIEQITDAMQERFGIGLVLENKHQHQLQVVSKNSNIKWLVPLEHVRTTYNSDEINYQEKTTTEYTADLRLNNRIVEHHNLERETRYTYDNWGNRTSVTDITTPETGWEGSSDYSHGYWKSVVRTSYLNTNSVDASKDPWWESEQYYLANPYLQGTILINRHDLINCKVIENWVPDMSLADTYNRRYIYSSNLYNSRGQLKKEAAWDGNNWIESNYSYDYETGSPSIFGNPTRFVDAEGAANWFEYDSLGFLSSRTLKDVEDIDENTFDITTLYHFNADSGWKEWEEDGNGNRTDYTYDGLGRMIKKIEPDDDMDVDNNPTTRINYNDTLLTSTVVNPAGSKIIYVYDSFENVYAEIREDVSETISNYDSTGRLIWTSGPNNGYTADGITYDPLYRPTTKFLYNYNGTKMEKVIMLPGGGSAEEEFDYLDNKQTLIDPLGNIQINYLDMNGHVLKNVKYNGEEEVVTCNYYDGLGNIIAVVENPHVNLSSPDYRVTGYEYNELNRLKETTLPGDTFYEWQGENLVEVTAGRPYKRFVYDNTGRIISRTQNISTSEDLLVEMIYDKAGRMIEEKTPFTQVDIRSEEEITGLAIKQYKYDNNGNLIEERTSDATVSGGQTTVNSTRVATVSYYANNQPREKTDAEGNITTYSYYPDKSLKSVTDPRGYNDQALYPGYDGDFITNYYYDGLKKLVKVELPRPADRDEKPETRYSYYLNGNLASKEQPGEGKISYLYNSRNKPAVEIVEEEGLQYIIRHTYDLAGNKTSSCDPRGNVTQWEYDDLARVVKVIYPDNTYEEFEYDKHDNAILVKDRKGQETDFIFNRYDWNTRFEDARDNSTRMYYDRMGNMLKLVDPEDNAETSRYNVFGQLLAGKSAVNTEDSYQYDGYRNLVYFKDSADTLVSYTYSGTGRPVYISYAGGSEVSEKEYWYDESGFIKRVRGADVVIDYNFTGGEYVPDPADRVLSKTWHHDAAVLGDETVTSSRSYTLNYSYDAGGRVSGIDYPQGEDVYYNYNNLQQLTSLEYESGSYLMLPPRYDLNDGGVLKNVSAANGIVTDYAWDNNGRLTTLAHSRQDMPFKSYQYDYDDNGNIIRINNDIYTFDSLDRLTGAAMEFEQLTGSDTLFQSITGYCTDDYSGNASLDFNFTGSETVKFDYSAASLGLNLQEILSVSKIRLNPALQSHRLDAEQLKVLAGVDNRNYSIVEGWEVTKLAGGELEVDLASPVSAQYVKVNCEYNDRDEDYGVVDNAEFFNDAGSIMELEYAGTELMEQTEVYTYDKIGNRLSLTLDGSTVVTYEYYTNTTGKNTSLLKTDGTYAYIYDDNGNLVKKGRDFLINGNDVTIYTNEEFWDYIYDLQNRLVRVDKDGVQVGSYEYDPHGLMIRRSGTTYYAYGLNDELLYKEETGGEYEKYIHLFNKHFAVEKGQVGQPVVERYYYHTDHLGSVVAMSDESGEVVWDNEYTPFGQNVFENGGELTELVYTGKRYDADAGLYYFNARWYDSSLGRFITRDSYPDGLNRYVYCANNPLVNIDPTGNFIFTALLSPIPVIGTIAGIMLDGAAWGAVAGVAVNTTMQVIGLATGNQDSFSFVSLGKSALVGAIGGALGGLGGNLIGGAISGAQGAAMGINIGGAVGGAFLASPAGKWTVGETGKFFMGLMSDSPEFDKKMFDLYWWGSGNDYHMTEEEFELLLDVAEDISRDENNDGYCPGEFNLSIGDFIWIRDENGIKIGMKDRYDFDWKHDGSRSFLEEGLTRLVSIVGWLFGATEFDITYP